MAKIKEKTQKDYTNLFVFTQKLRLDEDKRIMEEKLEATKQIASHGSFWDKTKTTFKNTYNKVVASAGSYEVKNKSITAQYDKFLNEHPTIISEEEAKKELEELIKEDSTNINQLMFDINLILDNKYQYTYPDKGLILASHFLHHDDNYLNNLKSELEKTYKTIADKSLSMKQLGALAGVSLATILACIIVPFATPAAVAGGAAVTTILVGATIISGTYISMKEYNKEEIKKQFRKFTADELAMHLSIQILCIKKLKEKLKEDEFKDKLNLILTELNTLKADLDYYLFVEKQDINKNKNKLNIFHGFDKALANTLGI